MKFATFSVPMIGGVYSVTRGLREGLKKYNIELRWIGVGPRGVQAMNEPGMETEREFGEVVVADETDMTRQAQAVINHLKSERYDGIIIDVIGGVMQANIARYLPETIVKVLVVHNITPGTYAFARAIRDYVHAVVGVSPRIRQDLVGRYGFPEDRTYCIPNAVNLAPFRALVPERDDNILKILSIGRIDEAAKGLFWLPDILSNLQDQSLSLTVAGDGPDLPELKKRMKACKVPASFIGNVMPEDVPLLMSQHNVMIMPSRYEGFGLTIIEAMAAGCVPIVSRIRGVTDEIITDGENGLLFPIGDTRRAAACISQLNEDRKLLARMSANARDSVKELFRQATNAKAYAELIIRIQNNPPKIATPLDIENWSLPRQLRPSLRSYLPKNIKNFLRTLRG